MSVRAFAQEHDRSRIEVGVTAGVPLQRVLRYQPNQYESVFFFGSKHDDDSFPIVIGPTVAINLTRHVAFETAALYRPIHLNEVSVPSPAVPGGVASKTTIMGSWWEFPLLGKVRLPGNKVSSFVNIGIVPHSERGHQSEGGSRYFRITSTTGFTVGGGLSWDVAARFRISPELRYSHWTKRYSNTGWWASPNRVDLVVGFSFR